MLQTKANQQESTWRLLTLGLALLFLATGLLTFRDYGMSWDQTTRWKSGDVKVDYYRQLAEAEDKGTFIRGYFTDNYPGLYDMTLSWLSSHLPADRLSIDQFMSFSFGFILFLAVVLLCKKISSWQLAFFAGLFLLCMPRLYGHAFINPKDIPFAGTYWLALLCLFGFATTPSKLPSWPKTLLCGIAIGACLATRIAGLVLFAYLALVIARALWLQREANASLRPILFGWAARLPAIVFSAYAVLIPFWPGIHKAPFAASTAILGKLHSVSNAIPFLYQGRVYADGQTPPGYAFGITSVTTPLFILALLAIGLLGAGAALRKPHALQSFLRGPQALLAAVLAFPFVYITLKQPYLHNGARHLLFALPALAIAAAASLIWIRGKLIELAPRLRVLPYLCAGAFALLQAIWMYSYHPYQYVFFNQLAGGPAQARFNYEFEYWFTANREAMNALVEKLEKEQDPRLEKADPIALLVAGPIDTVRYFADSRFSLTSDPSLADFFIAGTTLQTHELISAPVYLTVERQGVPLVVIKDLKARL